MSEKSLPERINSLLDDCKYGRVTNVDGSNAMIPLLQESLEQAEHLQSDLLEIYSTAKVAYQNIREDHDLQKALKEIIEQAEQALKGKEMKK